VSAKPRILVSAVASEFAALQLEVADLLGQLGFEPLLSDVAEGETSDQRPRLREKIDGCDAVLQLVGTAYGPEPPTIDSEFGRVSYAQFEYLHADQRGKKTWVILTRPGFCDDRSRARPDAVSDASVRTEAERDDAERSKLQDDYRARLQATGQVWCEVADEAELTAEIERLADQKATRGRALPAWRRMGRGHAAALAIVAAICGVSWLVIHRHQNQVVARALASIDSGRIRRQLGKSIDAAYEREMARARRLGRPEQQRTALSEAAKYRDENRADLDSVLDLITGTIASGQASPQFVEMSHILQQQGADAALAWFSQREAQLLERAGAEAARRERGLRGTLTPLLEAIPLLRERGDLAEADRLCERLMAAEPDWVQAQAQHVVTAMQSGERALAENRPMTAWQRFAAARKSGEQLLRRDPRNRLAQAHLVTVYRGLGELEYVSNHPTEANEIFDKSLALAKERAAADPSKIEAQLALLDTYGKTAEFRLRIGHYGEAAEVFQQGYEFARTLGDAAADDETTQRELADWYERVGQRFQRSGRAKPAAYQASLEIRSKLAAARPQDVASQRALARAYEHAGSVESGVNPFFLKSLEIRKRLAAGAPHAAEFQHDLAVLYDEMATQAAHRIDRVPHAQWAVWIHQAREFYGRDLEIVQRLAALHPNDRTAQHDLAVCYDKLADLSRYTGKSEEASAYREKQIEVLIKLAAGDPQNSEAELELAAAYEILADLNQRAGHVDRTRDCFQHAFDIRSRLALATPADRQALFRLELSCVNLAREILSTGDLDAAEQVCQRGIALLARLADAPAGNQTGKAGTTNAIVRELRECERARTLRGPLEALLQQPANRVPSLLYDRIGLLSAARDIDGVAKAAETLAKLDPKDQRNLYWAARGYALCAKLASGWPGYGPFPPKETAEQSSAKAQTDTHSDRQRYVRSAIEQLQAAKNAGFKNVAFTRNDADFAALREVPEFEKLVGGIP
jgi:tetratricopeptide (TPR) repeat protein